MTTTHPTQRPDVRQSALGVVGGLSNSPTPTAKSKAMAATVWGSVHPATPMDDSTANERMGWPGSSRPAYTSSVCHMRRGGSDPTIQTGTGSHRCDGGGVNLSPPHPTRCRQPMTKRWGGASLGL